MLTARQGYDAPHAFKMHRTYNIVTREPNLTEAQEAKKTEAFTHYVVHDTHLNFGCGGVPEDCDVDGAYGQRLSRHYPKSAVQDIAGRITGEYGLSLTEDGTSLVTAECITDPDGHQQWSVNKDQTITNDLSGKCLTAAAPYATGQDVTLEACDNSLSQRFTLLSDGRVLGPEGQCLTQDPPIAHLWPCNEGSPLSQRWVVEAVAATERSIGTDFSDLDLGSDATKARGFGLAYLNDDEYVDACVRRSDGVWCALGTCEGGFSSYSQWTWEFGDGQGWQSDKYGPTLEYADINGDGLADVCGRGYHGIRCAHSTGAGFGAPTNRTSSFSHASGYSAISRAQSVHLADVDGDGSPDVCGRGANGIECALNDGTGSFGAATSWLTDEFTDDQNWDAVDHGTTIMFGDINGDGRDDVCGRGTAAVICATSTGEKFEPSRWRHATDYTNSSGWHADVSYYGSMRLADIDGDGRADLCGRGIEGLWCSISQGTTSFDEKRLMLPGSFDDAGGWKQERFGATIQWADLNGDGHADPCGLGPDGIFCSHAPGQGGRTCE